MLETNFENYFELNSKSLAEKISAWPMSLPVTHHGQIMRLKQLPFKFFFQNFEKMQNDVF